MTIGSMCRSGKVWPSRRLVVGEHIGAAPRRREVRQDDARHLVEAEQMRGEHPAVAGDNAALLIDQHRVGEPKFADRGGDLCLHRGLELGCRFSVNPDAHATGEIASSTRWGVAIARKSGMPAEQVINTLGHEELGRWLQNRKKAGDATGRGQNPQAIMETA